MADLTVEAVRTLLNLRTDLETILTCHYCNNVLKKARTLNCPHHVCEKCAKEQNGECTKCQQNYFTRDITQNVCINDLLNTYNLLAVDIEKSAKLLDIKTDNKYTIKNDIDNSNSDDNSSHSSQDNNNKINNRKRKRIEDDDDNNNNNNNINDINNPNPKRRKLNNNMMSHTPDSSMINEMELKTNKSLKKAASLMNSVDIYPSSICVTGFNKQEIAQFTEYAALLGVALSTKWVIGATDAIISKYNVINNTPHITFKVLASILCGIPVIKSKYLFDCIDNNDNKLLVINKYICNYRRCINNDIFSDLFILFATTKMPNEKLRTLLKLGGATILETQMDIDDKDVSKYDKRLMIADNNIDLYQAKQLSEQYNCRVISENWVIKSIHDDDDNNNVSDMDPITERLDLDEYDLAIPNDDSDDSDSDDDSDDSDDESDDD